MALLAAIYDPSPQRARETLDAIRKQPLPTRHPLVDHEWSHGPWQIFCRCASTTPVQQASTPRQTNFLCGKLLTPDLDPISLDDLPDQPVSGYGAVLSIDHTSSTLRATTDAFGIFPLYHVTGADWFMVTSIPWIARHHPSFTPEYDLDGLAAILRTMHTISGQTLWKHVKRLAPGARLTARTAPIEINESPPYTSLPATAPPSDPEQAVIERLTRIMRALELPHAPQAILLSGGMDSRLIAGLLHPAQPQPVIACTSGMDTDLEVQCARLVSQHLGFQQQVSESTPDELFEAMQWNARLELASNGMNTALSYAAGQRLPPLRTTFTGYGLDVFMNKLSPATFPKNCTNDHILDHYGRWGLSHSQCLALRPDPSFRDALLNLREKQTQILNAFPDSTIYGKAQAYEMRYRQRLHVGANAWRIGWSTWPVSPAYDAILIQTLLAIPETVRQNRSFQINLLRNHFPSLAKLPIDRNTFDTSPLLPRTWFDDLKARLKRLPPARVNPIQSTHQLRYIRTMDINQPLWIQLRERIEPLRPILHNLFEPSAVDRILPPPHVPIPMTAPIPESSSRKTLIALALIGVSP
ncbi:MAG TPA: asparagine synthase-related protein [Kiritimatiellia bacterium]|nr:asparagine synthase-related protein [Kiritimatiellia bacterium]